MTTDPNHGIDFTCSECKAECHELPCPACGADVALEVREWWIVPAPTNPGWCAKITDWAGPPTADEITPVEFVDREELLRRYRKPGEGEDR